MGRILPALPARCQGRCPIDFSIGCTTRISRARTAASCGGWLNMAATAARGAPTIGSGRKSRSPAVARTRGAGAGRGGYPARRRWASAQARRRRSLFTCRSPTPPCRSRDVGAARVERRPRIWSSSSGDHRVGLVMRYGRDQPRVMSMPRRSSARSSPSRSRSSSSGGRLTELGQKAAKRATKLRPAAGCVVDFAAETTAELSTDASERC
jgi:hypothetical protein